MPKISALTLLAQADVVTTTDVLPIVDTSVTTTKKITVQAMVNAGLAALTTLPSNIVNASLNSITPTGGTLGVVGDIDITTPTTQVLSLGSTPALSRSGVSGALDILTNASILRLRPNAGRVLVNTTSDDGTSALQVNGNTNLQGSVLAQAGVRLVGASLLDANDGRLFTYEAPVSRFYIGDGTGYSFAFGKRAGGVSTDLVTITDAGALSVTGSISATGLSVTGGRTQFSGNGSPDTGAGVEVGYTGSRGIVLAYDRDASAYKTLDFDGLRHIFFVSGVEKMALTSTALTVIGSIGATNSTGRIDANDSRAVGLGIGGSLFLRGRDDGGAYQDYAGISAYLTDGTVGGVAADLIFKTSLAGALIERARLLASGELLIGQTTNINGARLAVSASSTLPAAIFKTGTDQNIWLRPASQALGAITGPALSAINDAANALTDLTLQGANVNIVIDNTLRGQWLSSGLAVIGNTSSNNYYIGANAGTIGYSDFSGAIQIHSASSGTPERVMTYAGSTGVPVTTVTNGGLAVTGLVSSTDYANIVQAARIQGTNTPGTGAGLELFYNSGGSVGGVQAYDRTGGVFHALILQGSTISINPEGSVRLLVSTSGATVTGLTTTDTLRVNVTPTAETPTATHTAVFNINGTNYKFLCLAA